MLWFDFFNHDNAHVSMMMEQFQAKVAPLVEKSLSGVSDTMTVNKPGEFKYPSSPLGEVEDGIPLVMMFHGTAC